MPDDGFRTENSRPVWELALDLALSDPLRALALADEAAAAATRSGSWLGLSQAEQARGLALRCMERYRESVRALERAVRVAVRAGEIIQAARAQASLSLSLGHVGANRRALRLLDQASGVLSGSELLRLRVQRAVVTMRLGQAATVVAELQSVLPELQKNGDRLWLARAWSTLGIAQVDMNDYTGADEALRRSEELFVDLGQHADAAGNRHNRGWCTGLAGDIPTALRYYREAQQQFEQLGLDVTELRLDRARLLASVGLFRQGQAVAEEALASLDQAEAPVAYAEALLAVAEAALLAGQPALADQHATAAIAVLRQQGRPARLALARLIALRAEWAQGQEARVRRTAERTAERLEAAGLRGASMEARLLSGRAALAAGDVAAGTAQLRTVAAGRRRGPAGHRVQAWFAEALCRHATGDRRGTERALTAGQRAMRRYRAGLGTLELRSRTAGYAQDLADLGRRLALETNRADRVLRWTEYNRAITLRLPPLRPPDDPELATDLAQLRRLRSTSDSGTSQQVDRVQRRIEQRTRERPGSVATPETELLSIGTLTEALGHRCLISLATINSHIHAITLFHGRLAMRPLGPAAMIEREVRFLMTALRRTMLPHRPARLAADAQRSLKQAGMRVGARLLDPLPAVAHASELVISPPAYLGGIPWGVIPATRDRAFTVTPSAASWLEAVGRPAGTGPVVLAAGPDLDFAESEVTDLMGIHDRATTLTGPVATVTAVRDALDGARLVHLAAHGEVDDDNPMFSAIRLADGPLMTYDLERLACPPTMVLLAACDSLHAQTSGEEALNMAVALLHLGTRTVLGAVTALPDEPARSVMHELHRRLAAGDPPAEALRHTRSAAADEPNLAAAAGCLVCVGAG